MTVNLAGNLRLDIDLPLVNCESFTMCWKLDEHASIILEGYVESDTVWSISKKNDSRIRIWMENSGRDQVLFHGRVANITQVVQAGMVKVCVEGISASFLLDQKKHYRSFQDTGKTFYDIINWVTSHADGQVICTADKTMAINKPVIQYEETDWEFSRRLASHLSAPVMPDVETGEPCFWIGVRRGGLVSGFSETWYVADVDNRGITYWVRNTGNYSLGDRTVFLGQEMVICEKKVKYQNGQLEFNYLLGNEQTWNVNVQYQEAFAGISLSGIVRSRKAESVSISLDIDNGIETGEYFYDWQPDTGNTLYAVPEPGSPISLYFGSQDESSGIAIHCLHKKATKANGKADFKSRGLNILNDQSIKLYDGLVDISKGGSHNVSLTDSQIQAKTSCSMEIFAEGKVEFRASLIEIDSPDEFVIRQG